MTPVQSRKLLALDIGGANLKAADGLGFALTRPFALWKAPGNLPVALAALMQECPPADELVVSMTGELADCYATKAQGVASIVTAVEQAARGRRIVVYRTDGELVAPDEAREAPLAVAASNWHALARFAGRFAPVGTAILIDIGSTTTDLIPLEDGKPKAAGRTDPERLVRGELVYTGVTRSPVCALVNVIPWLGESCPVAQEVFATTWDCYLTSGDLPEEPHRADTADGRPATRDAARDRLARMICADRTMFTQEDARAAADAVIRAQLARLGIAFNGLLKRMPTPPETAILSGQGEFLAKRLLERARLNCQVVSLTREIGPELSQAAPAHALAVLAREEIATGNRT